MSIFTAKSANLIHISNMEKRLQEHKVQIKSFWKRTVPVIKSAALDNSKCCTVYSHKDIPLSVLFAAIKARGFMPDDIRTSGSLPDIMIRW